MIVVGVGGSLKRGLEVSGYTLDADDWDPVGSKVTHTPTQYNGGKDFKEQTCSVQGWSPLDL